MAQAPNNKLIDKKRKNITFLTKKKKMMMTNLLKRNKNSQETTQFPKFNGCVAAALSTQYIVKSCFCSSIINLLVILIVFASHIVRSLILCVLKAKIFFLFAYCAANNTRKIPVYCYLRLNYFGNNSVIYLSYVGNSLFYKKIDIRIGNGGEFGYHGNSNSNITIVIIIKVNHECECKCNK